MRRPAKAVTPTLTESQRQAPFQGLTGQGCTSDLPGVERATERAAHARAVATAKGRRVGRPTVVDSDKLAYAAHLRDTENTIAQIVEKTGITRSSLYRHLPPRSASPVTAAGGPAGRDH